MVGEAKMGKKRLRWGGGHFADASSVHEKRGGDQ